MDMSEIEKESKRLEQTSNMEYLFKPVAPSDMLTVYYSDITKDHHSHGIFCALIPTDYLSKCLDHLGWDLHHYHGCPTSSISYDKKEEGITVYSRYDSSVGIEPLIIERNFGGIRPNYNEINEEFRLFHNLYHNYSENKYYKFDDDGKEELIAIVEENKIQIRLKEIRQFMSIKEMHLSIQFDYKEFSKYNLDKLGLSPQNDKKFIDKSRHWALIYRDSTLGGLTFSNLFGKFLILPFAKSKSGMWGFTEDKPKKYVDFIIGEDSNGKEILNTCNPDNVNTSASYLTPVDFRKAVLDKYYNEESKYKVKDGYISCCSLWGLEIDNQHTDKVSVWLNDLGENLSYEEQMYWRSYNIVPASGISDVFYKRQICAEFTDSDQPEHIFQVLYHKLAEECDSKLGYRILLPLSKEDGYHLCSIHVPTTEDQSKFDELILSLSKTLVDSINEKKLMELVPYKNDTCEKINGSINKIEHVFSSLGIEKYEEHLKFLRQLQELRSSSSAHRKGTGYQKIAKELGIISNPLRTISERFLVRSNDFLIFLNYQIEIGAFDKKKPS